MFESYNRLTGSGNISGNLPGHRLASESGGPAGVERVVIGGECAPTGQLPLASLEAADFFQVRATFLAKIRDHLEKMHDLAQSNAQGKVDKERCQAFYHHACTVHQIIATNYNGAPLFAKGGIVAQSGDAGNQLIMEGLDLSHPAICGATEGSITSKEGAETAQAMLDLALRHLKVVESVLDANLSRLAFLNKRVELVA